MSGSGGAEGAVDSTSVPSSDPRGGVGQGIGETIGTGDAVTLGAAAAADRSAPRRGVLARGTAVGRYVVLDILGAGGMGVVYSAYDPELDRRVAIKLLHVDARDGAAAAKARPRLLREAQAMARLTHPNVVTVHDVGTFEDSVFVAMEFVVGATLNIHVKRMASRPWRLVLELYVQAGRGLAAAHAAGIVHRDFKPDNVMVAEDGRVLVGDFGLARASGDRKLVDTGRSDDATSGSVSAPLEVGLTQTGAILGTPAYMAPEQMGGEPARPAADQFSFCVALYEAVYGERPFAGRSHHEIAGNVLRGDVRSAPTDVVVPRWLRAALIRGLEVEPDDRFESMDALLTALNQDQGRSRARPWMIAAAVTVVGATAVVAAQASAPPQPCLHADQDAAAAWGPDQAEVLRAKLGALDSDYATRGAERAVAQLDAYAAQWSQRRIAACEATHVDKEQSDELLQLRVACLDRRLHRMRVAAQVLADTDADSLVASLDAVGALPDLEPCGEPRRLRAEVPPPDEPQLRQAVFELQLQLEHVEALKNATHAEEAEALSREVVAAAEALGHQPTVAEALMFRASALYGTGRAERARAVGLRALRLAEATGFDRVILGSILALLSVEVRQLNDFTWVDERLARAESVLVRMGHEPTEAARLQLLRSTVAQMHDDWPKALGVLRRLAAYFRDSGQDESADALVVYARFANALVHENQLAEAKGVAERAREISRKVLGEAHPDFALTAVVLGRLAVARGEYVEGLEQFELARKVMAGALGPSHANVSGIDNEIGLVLGALGRHEDAAAKFESALGVLTADTDTEQRHDISVILANYGTVLIRLGRPAQALANYQRALRVRIGMVGADHQSLASLHDQVGVAHLEAGDAAAARKSFARALELAERGWGPEHERVVFPLGGLGRADWAQGKHAEARQRLERAVALAREHELPAQELAWAAFPLAKVLWHAGQRSDAIALARLAETGWATNAGWAHRLARVRRWLSAHDVDSLPLTRAPSD